MDKINPQLCVCHSSNSYSQTETIEELVAHMKREHMKFLCNMCGVVKDSMGELYGHKKRMHVNKM